MTVVSSELFKEQRGRRMKGVTSRFGSRLGKGISRIRRQSVSLKVVAKVPLGKGVCAWA